MYRLLPTFAILAAGCACEHGIGLSGDQDAADETNQSSWDPPIENLGEPGWRESTEPLCPGLSDRIEGYDVWSDPRGVFLIGADEVQFPEDGMHPMHHLFVNDGTGWVRLIDEVTGIDSSIERIMGLPGGTIFGWGHHDFWTIEDSVATRETEYSVQDVFVVDDSLAYACSSVGLLQHDGTSWTRVAPDLDCPGYHLWATEGAVYAAGNDGLVYSLDGDAWIPHETGIFSDLSSIWGFGGDDVWVGSTSGRMIHYDGTTWTEMEWPVLDESPFIEGMWGAEGTLFFHTGGQLVRWDGGSFSTLGYWPTGEYIRIEIAAIWGNSTNEVFLAVRDTQHPLADCGTEYLLWWDGTNFHWF